MFSVLSRLRRSQKLDVAQVPPTAAQCLLRAGIFNPDLYLQLNPDVAAAGANPAEHYIEHGHREGREPHPLFDIGWYAEQLPVADRSQNPLIHYAETGASQQISPNVFFDAVWYQDTYAPVGDPLVHFIEHGGHRTNPSVFFDAIRYFGENPDIASAGINPLIHYMLYGMQEGRAVYPVSGTATVALSHRNAKLTKLKQVARSSARTALLITHAPTVEIKRHVEHYARAFRSNDVDVCLIIASDQPSANVPQSLMDLCASVYLRENIGFDFAAWAHVLDHDPSLKQGDTLYLTNDSIIGPLDAAEFSTILSEIESRPEPFVGLTDNQFYAWHLQSYFIAVKQPCLASVAFSDYFGAILNLKTKNAVIRSYEITLTRRMEQAGFTAATLFPMLNRQMFAGNRAVLGWRQLADGGMPFLKASLVLGEQKLTEGPEARVYLSKRGYDLSLLPA